MMISNTLSIATLIPTIAQRLQVIYPDSTLCKQYAWWMLEAITHQNKTSLLLQQTISLSAEQTQQLECWIQRQIQENIPLQYLIGSVPFGDCTIVVRPPTLIPRPETEEWCHTLLDQIRLLSYKSLRILDMCTGSGCIAIAIARALPQATIYATDISKEALALAQQNATHNQVNNIIFVQSDLFYALTGHTFDIIIANPPYIPSDQWSTLDRSVRDWEDKNALISGENGTSTLQRIIKQAPNFLNSHPELIAKNIPHLVIEIDHTQGNYVTHLFHNAGFSSTVIKKDLQGCNRLVTGQIHNEACSQS
jgi:release factor glutamine methyltransferase